MTIKFIPVKCPECGADMQIKEGTNQCFCNYCGRHIIIKDSNEYIFRNVDEARITESENNKLVRLKELEIEQQKTRTRRGLIIAFIAAELLLVVLGGIGYAIDNAGLGCCLLLAMGGLIFAPEILSQLK